MVLVRAPMDSRATGQHTFRQGVYACVRGCGCVIEVSGAVPMPGCPRCSDSTVWLRKTEPRAHAEDGGPSAWHVDTRVA